MPRANVTEYGEIIVGDINKFNHRAERSKVCFKSGEVNIIANYNNHYKIHSNLIGKELCVVRECKEFEMVEKLVNDIDAVATLNYANKLLIENLDPEDLIKLFEAVRNQEYNRGRMDTQYKIKSVLGLED